MRSNTTRATRYLFTAAVVFVPAMAITACGGDDDNTGGGTTTLLDGSTNDVHTSEASVPNDSGHDANLPETGPAPSDSGSDSALNDSGSDAADAGNDSGDAGVDSGVDSGTDSGVDSGKDASADADAATATTVDNATYQITAWTCTHTGSTKDIKAFAETLGISEVDLTIAALGGHVDAIYAAPACTRETPVTVLYPQPGKIATTNGVAHTCTATCSTTQCNPATPEVPKTDTYDFTKTTTTFTGTRTLVAADVNGTLQAAAGCVVGDLESATYTKK